MAESDSKAKAMTPKLPTFQQSRDDHDRTYLTKVLEASGGERQRAAEIAGLNRTHLQSLIKRFGLREAIPYNPKTRGRHRVKQQSSEQSSNDETSEAEAPRGSIQF